MNFFRLLALLPPLLFFASQVNATEDLAQANNPLANMQAFNLQNYYYPQISGFDQKGDTFWLRYAQPVDKFLVRTSMPFTSYPVAPTVKKNGSGDFNVFATDF